MYIECRPVWIWVHAWMIAATIIITISTYWASFLQGKILPQQQTKLMTEPHIVSVVSKVGYLSNKHNTRDMFYCSICKRKHTHVRIQRYIKANVDRRIWYRQLYLCHYINVHSSTPLWVTLHRHKLTTVIFRCCNIHLALTIYLCFIF